jgi:hypothetical protein
VNGSSIFEFSVNSSARVVNSCKAFWGSAIKGSAIGDESAAVDTSHNTDSPFFARIMSKASLVFVVVVVCFYVI